MPRLVVQVNHIELDRGAFTRALNEAIDRRMRRAAKAFLKVVVDNVPIKTGTSRGSLLPLGRLLRISSVVNLSGAEPDAKRGRTPEAGAKQVSSPPYFTNEKGKYALQYSTKVLWYILNETFGRGVNVHASPSAPWHSFDKGRDAFKKDLKSLKQDIPKISNYLITTRVSNQGRTI